MGRGVAFDPAAIRAAFADFSSGTTAAKTRALMLQFGCSKGTVDRAIKGRSMRSQSSSPAGPGKVGRSRATVLAVGHPATIEKRTLFPTMVFDVGEEWLLKSGEYSGKIGKVVAKGAWAGFPIYTLTLEERATCPVSCRHWSSCYGNSTPFARRWREGPALEWRLEREVAALELDYPGGFAVRLHNLGDFYSVGYVGLWRTLLDRHAALHVFGYTARIDSKEDDVSYAVARLVRDYWPRFAVRFSNAPVGKCSTISIESPVQKPADAFICPAQWTPSGKKSECCATCALCWSTTKRVAFLQH